MYTWNILLQAQKYQFITIKETFNEGELKKVQECPSSLQIRSHNYNGHFFFFFAFFHGEREGSPQSFTVCFQNGVSYRLHNSAQYLRAQTIFGEGPLCFISHTPIH